MNHEHIKNYNDICVKLIKSLFTQEFICSELIKDEPTPSFPSKYMVQIGLRNKSYQLSLILGVTEPSSELLLSEVFALTQDSDERRELAKSALGELCNTIACEFAIISQTVNDFGKLLPTPPLVWITSSKVPDFIEGDGLTGELHREDKVLHTHISTLPISSQNTKQDGGNWNPTQSLSIYDPHSFDGDD